MDRYCGGRLSCYHNAKVAPSYPMCPRHNSCVQTTSEIISSRRPFTLGVLTDSSEPTNFNNRGFYLLYRQYQC